MVAKAFLAIKKYVDRLEIALKIKAQVFGFSPQYLTHRTDIEEIRSKMGPYSYLTVNHTDLHGNNIPIGVVHAEDLQREILGTVSLRDFCNREETKIPSYLEIISVIDHHKSDLSTSMPSSICVKDVQSANTLVAYKAFAVNDRYAMSTLSKSKIEKQCERAGKKLDSIQDIRIYQKLLEKKKMLSSNTPYYVDPQREFVEYLHFVYAILEDTDLLTKVSRLDVECMASLLNRLKSLAVKEEVEIVHFDDIVEDKDFTKKLAKRLLQNEDFYSLYSRVYRHKEESIDKGLHACIKERDLSVFSDTKILNACNRVGQIKIFMSNYKSFKKIPRRSKIHLVPGSTKIL